MKIKPEDIKIEAYLIPASDFGLPKVCVRITHIPTGIIASCCEANSEYSNREIALKILTTELAKLEEVNCLKIPVLKTGDMPKGSYLPFKAMAQGKTDYELDVMYVNTSDYGKLMCIGASEEAVYITREQAKAFFGFKD